MRDSRACSCRQRLICPPNALIYPPEQRLLGRKQRYAQLPIRLYRGVAWRPVGVASQGPTASQKQVQPPTQCTVPPDDLDDYRRSRLRFGEKPSEWGPRPLAPPLARHCGLWQEGHLIEHLLGSWKQLSTNTSNSWGRLLYLYFNWRQDTSKDLFLILSMFSSFVLLGSTIRHWVIDTEQERHAATGFWNDVYQVCQWVFGQQFPTGDSSLAQQVFAVATAVMGLCVFALVLALVEQVVLEAMEANVKRGSRVYETGHHLILGWCVSQRDLEVVRKILQQLCTAYKPEGGVQVVVLTQRSKLEMESTFWRSLPACQRYGTQIIFRQGSPLVPSDLKMVAACKAAATVIVSDQSRSAAEADAQSIRCAILLDELDLELDKDSAEEGDIPGSRKGNQQEIPATPADGLLTGQRLDVSMAGRQVVVELKTSNALPLLKYACSNRVMALPTSQLNAQRLAKMVKRPVISIISQQLFNFENIVSMYVHYYPHLVGRRFGDLAFLFPDGIVMGLVDRITGKARMAPSRDRLVSADEALVLIRPTAIASHAYHPLPQATDSTPLVFANSSQVFQGSQDQGILIHSPAVTIADIPAYAPAGDSSWGSGSGVSGHNTDWNRLLVSQVEVLRRQVGAGHISAVTTGNEVGAYAITSEYQNNIVAANMQPGAVHVGPAGLQKMHSAELGSAEGSATDSTVVTAVEQSAFIKGALSNGWTPEQPFGHNSIVRQPPSTTSTFVPRTLNRRDTNTSEGTSPMPAALRTGDWPVLSGRPHETHKLKLSPWFRDHMTHKTRQGKHRQARDQPVVSPSVAVTSSMDAGEAALHTGSLSSMLDCKQHSRPPQSAAVPATSPHLLVPVEYLQVDEGPERVLVLGWGPSSLMTDLIKELDHGLSALPAGSEVVFANMHPADESLGLVLQNVSLEYIKVCHVIANPLQRSSLASKLDLSTFRCAVVLCDELWVDPDSNDSNGIDGVDEPSVLRLDSLVMVTQLNVRKLLEDSRRPPINIICQKIATEGLTRFEDRNRLPLGISINLNSFSAKVLSQLAANPLMLYPVTRLGEDAQLTILDSSSYAAVNEVVTWWQLVARCQAASGVLIGYYAIPDHLDEPLHTVVDPLGMEERCKPRVWNCGDGRLKFIILRSHNSNPHSNSSGSVDDMELVNTQQAQWVRNTVAETAAHTPIASSHNSSDQV